MYQFLSDETLKRAVTRSLEIIGEATKKIPADVKYEWNDISWKQMAGTRDKLIHDYMGVNYLIVWDVAKNIIPVLIPQIEAIIDKEKENRINRRKTTVLLSANGYGVSGMLSMGYVY